MHHYARKVTVGVVSALAVFGIAGGVIAATSFHGQGTVDFDSIKVGQQGVGGVTYFNGTMINNTTGSGNFDNPVTVGDNLRVDGRVYRGATPGTSDSKPFVVNDNAQIDGSLTVGGLPVSTSKRYEGTFDVAAAGDFVATYDYGYDCTANSSYPKYAHTHMKRVAVAEANLTNPADIRVFVKPADNTDYSSGPYPENNNVWLSSGLSIGNGYVYFTYKTVQELCNGTTTTSNTAKGEYKIIVQ